MPVQGARRGREELAWSIGLGLLCLTLLGIVLGVHERAWTYRHRQASAWIPIAAAMLAGGVTAFRVVWLVRGREGREGAGARVLAAFAGFDALAGIAAAAFFGTCALQGSCGSRGFAYGRAVDILLVGLLTSAFLVPVQVIVAIVRALSRDPAWRVHTLAALAWVSGALALFGLGIAFLLG